MKQILVALLFLPCMGGADEVYDRFLDLKRRSVVAWNEFYHSLSNNMADKNGVWRENGSGLIFSAANNNGNLTNLEYFVDLVKVSTNIVSTNLSQVSQCFCNDDDCLYTYRTNGVASMIEVGGEHLGDLNIYQIDADGELDAYIATTNFIGIHGVRQYRNGNIIRVGPIPNLEIFRP